MAHPHSLPTTLRPVVIIEGASPGKVDESTAELLLFRRCYLTTELGAHGLLAITNAKYWHP
jgi:hypothetical protein